LRDVPDDMLVVENLGKRVGNRWILQGVSFRLAPGQALGIFGPNGAGKSTLLRVLATIMRASSGSARWRGEDVFAWGPQWRAHFGYLAHQPLLYPDLSARENLQFHARLRSLSRPAALVEQALERAGLSLFADEPVRYFSRGMQQRLAIERAFLGEPAFLFLDEPYNALDAGAADALDERLRTYTTAGGCVLMVTHDVEKGLGLVTQVLVLDMGVCALSGAKEEMDPAMILAAWRERGHGLLAAGVGH